MLSVGRPVERNRTRGGRVDYVQNDSVNIAPDVTLHDPAAAGSAHSVHETPAIEAEDRVSRSDSKPGCGKCRVADAESCGSVGVKVIKPDANAISPDSYQWRAGPQRSDRQRPRSVYAYCVTKNSIRVVLQIRSIDAGRQKCERAAGRHGECLDTPLAPHLRRNSNDRPLERHAGNVEPLGIEASNVGAALKEQISRRNDGKLICSDRQSRECLTVEGGCQHVETAAARVQKTLAAREEHAAQQGSIAPRHNELAGPSCNRYRRQSIRVAEQDDSLFIP